MRTTQKDIDDQLPAFAQRLKASGLHIVPRFRAEGRPLAKKQFVHYPGISHHRNLGELFDHIEELGGMVIEGTVVPAGRSLFS